MEQAAITIIDGTWSFNREDFSQLKSLSIPVIHSSHRKFPQEEVTQP